MTLPSTSERPDPKPWPRMVNSPPAQVVVGLMELMLGAPIWRESLSLLPPLSPELSPSSPLSRSSDVRVGVGVGRVTSAGCRWADGPTRMLASVQNVVESMKNCSRSGPGYLGTTSQFQTQPNCPSYSRRNTA